MKIKDTRRSFVQFAAMPNGTWFLRGSQPSLKLSETTGYNAVMRVIFVVYNTHREQYLPIHWEMKEIRGEGPLVPFAYIEVGQLFEEPKGGYELKVDHTRAFSFNDNVLLCLPINTLCQPLEAEFVF